MSRKRIFCFAEDRAGSEIGLRLALASLREFCPRDPIAVYCGWTNPEFTRWAEQLGNLILIPSRPEGGYSWNCKPHTLRPFLDQGYDEAIWVDSDILVTRDPQHLFEGLDDEVLVGTQEASSEGEQGSEIRTRGLGLELGNIYPWTLNSCIVRATRKHLDLLDHWSEILGSPEYRAIQSKPFPERPRHYCGDQDVLSGLIGAKRHRHIPVKFLRSGLDIIHCGGALGYSSRERLVGLVEPIPPFLHAIAGKPWHVFAEWYAKSHSTWFVFYRRLLQETSPYVLRATRWKDRVAVPCEWMNYHSLLGGLLKLCGGRHHALTGLPLSVVATLAGRLVGHK